MRIVYRFAELSAASNEVNSAVVTGEGYFWALEAAPMFIAILAFNIVHPGKVLVGESAQMPGFFATCISFVKGRRGKKEFLQASEKYEQL